MSSALNVNLVYASLTSCKRLVEVTAGLIFLSSISCHHWGILYLLPFIKQFEYFSVLI